MERKCICQVVLKDEAENKEWRDFMKWRFDELPPTDNNHYGNGIYIAAIRVIDQYETLIDCRYIKGYTFENTVKTFLQNYYGTERIARIDIS